MFLYIEGTKKTRKPSKTKRTLKQSKLFKQFYDIVSVGQNE